MTKFSKILLGCLAAGVLLLGIGSTIAFFEISAIQYGGEKAYAVNAQTTTKVFRESLDDNIHQINLYPISLMSKELEVVSDESVPVDQMVVEITYPINCSCLYQINYYDRNGEYYSEKIYGETYDDDYEDFYHHDGSDNTDALTMDVQIGVKTQNVSALFRQVIDDLKADRIYSYYPDSSAVVRINPVNLDKITSFAY